MCGVVSEATHADMVSGVRTTGRRWGMREKRLWVHLKKGAREVEVRRIINAMLRKGRDSGV